MNERLYKEMLEEQEYYRNKQLSNFEDRRCETVQQDHNRLEHVNEALRREYGQR